MKMIGNNALTKMFGSMVMGGRRNSKSRNTRRNARRNTRRR